MTRVALNLLAAVLMLGVGALFAEEGSVTTAPFTLTYRVILQDGAAIGPGRYSAALDDRGSILVFDAAGEQLLRTLKPFMVQQLSRPVENLSVVVEEGPGRPTYIRVYHQRRASHFREFEITDLSGGCCE